MAQNTATSSLPSIEYIEKIALDHCSWFFNQDVRIITFSKPAVQIVFTPTGGGRHFTAIVLPSPCAPGWLAEPGPKDIILLKVEEQYVQGRPKPTRDSVIRMLLDVVQQRIGGIIDFDQQGRPSVSKRSLPVGYNHTQRPMDFSNMGRPV